MTDRSIVEAATRLRRQREPYLVATVVCAHGTAHRRPGARMILTRFRWVAGAISGGCLEGDLSNHAWWQTRDGSPLLVTYDSSADDVDVRSAFGLGGDGVVEVLVERAGIAGRIDALEVAERCLRAHRRGAIATVYRTDYTGGTGNSNTTSTTATIRVGARLARIAGGPLEQELDPLDDHARARIAEDMDEVIARGASANRSYVVPGGTIDVLIEAVRPPPCLFLLGAGHDAVPIVALARSVGWDIAVCVDDPPQRVRDRFANTPVIATAELAARVADCDRAVAIVMNHDPARDRDAIGALLETRIGYIGVVGPRDRTRRLLRELGADDEDPRVHAPVGLDLGAEAPPEIALAIVAELQAVVARTAGANLIVTDDERRVAA